MSIRIAPRRKPAILSARPRFAAPSRTASQSSLRMNKPLTAMPTSAQFITYLLIRHQVAQPSMGTTKSLQGRSLRPDAQKAEFRACQARPGLVMINDKWKMKNGKCRRPSRPASICHLSVSIFHLSFPRNCRVCRDPAPRSLRSLSLLDIGIEQIPKPELATVNIGLNSAFSAIHHLGDLLIAQSFVSPQNDSNFFILGKRPERAAHHCRALFFQKILLGIAREN